MRSLFRGLTQTDFLLIQRCPTLLGPSHGRVELSHVPFSFFYALYIALIDTEHFTRTGEGPCAKLGGGSGGPLRVGVVDVVSWWSTGAIGLVSWSACWQALLDRTRRGYCFGGSATSGGLSYSFGSAAGGAGAVSAAAGVVG